MLATEIKPINVLLVEDHKCVLWGLEKLIAGESPRLRVAGKASTSNEALAAAAQVKPDVILLDLDLNGEMSLDVLPELLRTSDAKVLILTGTRDSELHRRAMLAGARGVISKSEDAAILLRAIERVHEGEIWLDRVSTADILQQLTSRSLRRDPEARKIETLTARERQIIAAVVKERGGSNKAIAAGMHMSEHTLRNHLSSIYGKLEVRNRLELYMYATDHGLAECHSEALRLSSE
jgi:two-component system, NarL family, nitrate/nitrite response regulator NarL